MTTLDADKVLEGRHGYLFLTNDTNRVLDQIQGSYGLPRRQLWETGMVHAARAALVASCGARYHHIIVPDRETVLSSFLPEGVQPGRHGLTPVSQYRVSGAADLLPPIYEPMLLQHRPDDPAYFQRDTHWTFSGAWRYFTGLSVQLEIDTALLLATLYREVAYENPGDLGSKIGAPSESGIFKVPVTDWAKPAYDSALSNVGRMRLYDNAASSRDERWLVLHDSFGEWLTLIMPALAGTTCFIHTPDFDELFVRDYKPTRVFSIQIERFFIRQPLNGVDYDVFFNSQAEAKSTALEPPPKEVLATLFPSGRSS